MKRSLVLIVMLSLFAFHFCTKDDSEFIRKEKEEMSKRIDGKDVALYKGIKLVLRSAPVLIGQGECDWEQYYPEASHSDLKVLAENTKITSYLMTNILGMVDSVNSDNKISISEYYDIYSELNNLRDVLQNIKEDDMPTILEAFSLLLNSITKDETVNTDSFGWSSDLEHLIFAAIIDGCRKLPSSFKIYEISQIEMDQVANDEYKPIIHLYASMVFMEEEWYYLAENALTKSIESLENGDIKVKYGFFDDMFESGKTISDEDLIKQFHAISLLARGYMRKKMTRDDKDELALDDFEGFVNDLDELAIDNEIGQTIGAYVHISREETDKALECLSKLEKSKRLSSKEIEAIGKIKTYVSDRDNESALNSLYDKLFIAKMLTAYGAEYVNESGLTEKVKETKAGEMFTSIPEKIEGEYNKMTDKIPDLDDISQKGKELLDKVFD